MGLIVGYAAADTSAEQASDKAAITLAGYGWPAG